MSVRAGKKFDDEVLAERARNLDARGLNGIARVFVRLLPAAAPTEAWLDVEFHTTNVLAAILAAIGGGANAHSIFPITGGTRLRGGPRQDKYASIRCSLVWYRIVCVCVLV